MTSLPRKDRRESTWPSTRHVCRVALALSMIATAPASRASSIGYADIVLDYFDSGAGPIAGPYGGTFPSGPGYPISVSTSVVLGSEPGVTGHPDFLSLPTGSYVTVGFTDETVIDGSGNDIFVQEVGGNGERANIFVSSDLVTFVFLGIAIDNATTAFDLASIGFSGAVQAVKIVGLDSSGGSPGFDVMNIQVLPGSIGPAPVPIPAAYLLFASALVGLRIAERHKKGSDLNPD